MNTNTKRQSDRTTATLTHSFRFRPRSGTAGDVPSLAGVALSFALASAACTDLKSADLRTAGMSAYMTVQADGSGQTQVSTKLYVDNNSTDYVTLSSGDSLVASVAGHSETMTESNILGIVSYAASFSGQDGSGAAYTVALHRGAMDVSAPNSTCSLPMAYTIGAPATGSTFSRANDAMTVNYGPGSSGDAVNYSLSGSCIMGSGNVGVSGDPGSFTLARGSILAVPNQPPSQSSCEVTLTITRTRAGTVDPAYGSGGQMNCVQTRSATFTSTP
jgi:hypothetical protein